MARIPQNGDVKGAAVRTLRHTVPPGWPQPPTAALASLFLSPRLGEAGAQPIDRTCGQSRLQHGRLRPDTVHLALAGNGSPRRNRGAPHCRPACACPL